MPELDPPPPYTWLKTNVGFTGGVAVAVGVAVGVFVGVAVGVLVGVPVAVGDPVGVAVGVGVGPQEWVGDIEFLGAASIAVKSVAF